MQARLFTTKPGAPSSPPPGEMEAAEKAKEFLETVKDQLIDEVQTFE